MLGKHLTEEKADLKLDGKTYHLPVIVGSDFNVAHKEIDLAHPKRNDGGAGFTRHGRLVL